MVVNLAAYQNLDDHLGTTQMELSSGGWPLWQGQFTPFEQEIIGGTTTNYLGPQPADGTAMHYKFTGKERDSESGLDYFGARYYASSMGRWMSPDWADKPEAVPYSSLDNPQSLNLYGYVGNNPLSKADPDGHDPSDPCWCSLLAGKIENAISSIPISIGWHPGNQIMMGYPTITFSHADRPPAANPARPGTKGKPDHQATAAEEADKIGGKTEVTIPTPGGAKGSRRGDAVRVNPETGAVEEVTQVIRPTPAGNVPKREQQAAQDIQNATGVKPNLVPVRPLPPPPPPPPTPTPKP